MVENKNYESLNSWVFTLFFIFSPFDNDWFLKKDVRRKILASFIDRRTFKTFGRWIIVAKNGCIRLQRRSLHGYTSHAANIVYKVCICAPSGNACDTCNAPHSHTRPPFFFFPLYVPVVYAKLYAAIECRGCTQCKKQISQRSENLWYLEFFNCNVWSDHIEIIIKS